MYNNTYIMPGDNNMGTETESDITQDISASGDQQAEKPVVIDTKSHSYDPETQVVEGKISALELVFQKNNILKAPQNSNITFNVGDKPAQPCDCPVMDVNSKDVSLEAGSWNLSLIFRAKSVPQDVVDAVELKQCFNVNAGIIHDKIPARFKPDVKVSETETETETPQLAEVKQEEANIAQGPASPPPGFGMGP